MKNLLALFTVALLAVACGTESSENENLVEEKEPNPAIEKFDGQYYLGERQEGSAELVLKENCWSKQLDAFELSEFAGSPGEYYFAFHGHHSTMYLVESGMLDEETLVFSGVLEDESSDEVFEYKMTKVAENVYELTHKNEVYLLVPQAEKDKFPYEPCEEEESAEMSELDYINEIFKVFFALKEGGDALQSCIPAEGTQLLIPGPGAAPEEANIKKAEEVLATELFNTPAYDRLLEYIQMHNNEERGFLEFVDELPDRCMPKKEALFVSYTDSEEGTVAGIAMLTKMNDEQGEVYTYVVVHFEYADHMKIIKIDASNCGA